MNPFLRWRSCLIVILLAAFLVLPSLVMLMGSASAKSQVIHAAEGTELLPPTNTPENFTASPVPTSTTPANFIVIDNARSETYTNTSLVIDPDGMPVIAYAKRPSSGLALARCNNAITCDAPVITTIDADASSYVKLVLDGDIPVFTFVDADQDLKVARCTDGGCGSLTLATIESAGSIVTYDIGLDHDNLPVIAYTQKITYSCPPSTCTDTHLKLAHCNNLLCDSPTITLLDTHNWIRELSLIIDSNNRPIISYGRQELYLVLCDNPNCSNRDIISIDENGYGSHSIQLDANDIPVIAYGGGWLKLTHCNNNTACDHPTISVVEYNYFYGESVSLALHNGIQPYMAYYDRGYGDLKFDSCSDLTCSSSSDMQVLDGIGHVGAGVSLKLSNGKPYISYLNRTTGKVMLYIENKPPPPTITPTPSHTPSLTATYTQTLITPTSPPNSTPGPNFFAQRQPTLTWAAVSWALGYQIEIDDDPTFASPVSAETDANTQTYTTDVELVNGRYYWRVRAKVNDSEWGKWSATETIIVSAP